MEDIELADLLKYKEKVELTNISGKILKTVWIRVLGDYDLQLCYRLSRLASAKKRSALRTPGTDEYEAEVAGIPFLNTIAECKDLIKSARTSNIIGEAYANLDREEPPKLDEITDQPDAPTLEDQEILDKQIDELEANYQARVQQYITDRLVALDSELNQMSDDEIYKLVQLEMSNILSLQEFHIELTAQKIFRATFRDEKCSVRAYKTIEEFKNAASFIKSQLTDAYNTLELSPEQVKD